jgi:hypothetical protein
MRELDELTKDGMAMGMLRNGTAGSALLCRAVYAILLYLIASK